MKLSKRISCFLALVVILSALTVIQAMNAEAALEDLSQTTMDTVIGGACEKHCSDDNCSGWTCFYLLIFGYQTKINNGTTGRECGGNPAASCTLSDQTKCADWHFNCNSDCTTCANSTDVYTYKTCSSTSL
jgi:hypothetical protein